MNKQKSQERLSILLAEDDSALNETLCDYFIYKKYKVDSFFNGKDAFNSLKENHYDIIISDIMMDGGSGLDLLNNVKNNKNTEEIPFIIISAKATSQDLRKGMSLGADDYLFKPFSLSDLEKSIHLAFNKFKNKQKQLFTHQKNLKVEKKRVEKLEYFNNHIVRKHISNALGLLELLLLKYPNEDLLNYLKGEIDSVDLISFDQIKAETSLNSFSKNPKKILLVDDDEVALFYNKRMIELYMGAESIETISNPKLVPDFFKLNKSNIDLMILDLNMPKLNGLELLDILQKNGLSCPTIILSYDLSEVDQKNLAIFNVIEIWSKPLTEDQIKDFME